MNHSDTSDLHAASFVLAAVQYTVEDQARDLAAADEEWDRGHRDRASKLWFRAGRLASRRQIEAHPNGLRIVARAHAVLKRAKSDAGDLTRRHAWRAPRRPRARARRRQNRRTLARASTSDGDGDGAPRACRSRGGVA